MAVAFDFREQRPGMTPGQQRERDEFNAANRTPNARNAVPPPNRGRITDAGKSDVMQQIKLARRVESRHQIAGGTLPEQIV